MAHPVVQSGEYEQAGPPIACEKPHQIPKQCFKDPKILAVPGRGGPTCPPTQVPKLKKKKVKKKKKKRKKPV